MPPTCSSNCVPRPWQGAATSPMLHETNLYHEPGNAPYVLPCEALFPKPNLKADGFVSLYTAINVFAPLVSARWVMCYVELKQSETVQLKWDFSGMWNNGTSVAGFSLLWGFLRMGMEGFGWVPQRKHLFSGNLSTNRNPKSKQSTSQGA